MRLVLSLLVLALLGCEHKIPKEALMLREESLGLRHLQTRRFETSEEKRLLSAGSAVLQDLGFVLDEAETELGVIVGSKQRDAQDAGQIVGSILIGGLLGAHVPWDKEQKIRASVVTRPITDRSIALRVTFQRVVWNSDGKISKTEGLEDSKMYQEFFDKLSKAVFLEAHEI